MKVYGLPPSPFTRKVVVALEEKGIPSEYEEMAPFPKRPALMEKNPLGYIPILEDQGQFVLDSSVICAYLERVRPASPIYPDDPFAYARALFLEEYADTIVANAVGPIFLERFAKPVLFNQAGDESVVRNTLDDRIPPAFDYVENQLSGGDTILGSFSVADAALGSVLASLRLADERIDVVRWPKLAAYYENLLARPSFKKSMPKGY